MVSSTEQCKGEPASSTHIAVGIILGLGCFAVVLTGGFFIGKTIGKALITVQMSAPFEIDPLR